MNQKKRTSKRKAATAAVLCFMAAITIVGTYTFKDYRESQQELAEAEKQSEKIVDAAETANTNDIVNEDIPLEEEKVQTDSGAEVEANESEDVPKAENNEENTAQKSADSEKTSSTSTIKNIDFQSGDKMLRPTSGSVCMEYSMDKTVYFQTLDQYKYNPALIIGGAVGDQVICGAPGVIKSIDVTAETGTTINVDLGNGYEVFYGQLKEVPVKTGDYVEAKTVLGYISEPTKYYSIEGANVYFEMRKDGQPVNPEDYLVE